MAGNTVRAIYHDLDGYLWLGTGSDVSCHDGTAWTTLDTRDGLGNNTVRAIHKDPDGFLWFGTDGGLTHFHSWFPQLTIAYLLARF